MCIFLVLKERQLDKIVCNRMEFNGEFFCFTALLNEKKNIFSERDILSVVTKVFDVLGLLSSCVVFVKILLQDLRKFSLTFDELFSQAVDIHSKLLRGKSRLLQCC